MGCVRGCTCVGVSLVRSLSPSLTFSCDVCGAVISHLTALSIFCQDAVRTSTRSRAEPSPTSLWTTALGLLPCHMQCNWKGSVKCGVFVAWHPPTQPSPIASPPLIHCQRLTQSRPHLTSLAHPAWPHAAACVRRDDAGEAAEQLEVLLPLPRRCVGGLLPQYSVGRDLATASADAIQTKG